jgi:AcrR family transcriptional regulator
MAKRATEADAAAPTTATAAAVKQPPRRGRPRDAHVDRAILDATLQELRDVGYQRMSLDGIATRAGVSKPTIYRRWPNKPSLAIGAIEVLVAQEGPVTTGNTRNDLKRQLQHAHDNLQRASSVTLIGTLLAEKERHPRFLETYRERLVRPRRAKITEILRAAQERGEIREDADIETAALILTGFLPANYIVSDKPQIGDWLGPGVDLVLAALR